MPSQTTERGDRVARAGRLDLEMIAVITDLLEDDADVYRGVEACRGVKGLP